MISPELLQILRCPETMQPVRIASALELESFSAQVGIGTRVAIAPTLEAGLIREDGKVLYPIRNGIPVMLLEEAIRIA